MVRSSLQRRIIFIVLLAILTMAAVMGATSYLAVRGSINQTLKERLLLAQTTAGHLEYVMSQSLSRLGNVAFFPGLNLEDGVQEPERQALHQAYLQTIFSDGVYLVNREGRILWTEPYRSAWVGRDVSTYPQVGEALGREIPVVSDIYYQGPEGRPVVSAAVPIKDRQGKLAGLAAGDIDLTGSSLAQVLRGVRLGSTGYVEVVDSQGIVLASTRPELVLSVSDHRDTLASLIRQRQSSFGTCHSCHEQAQPVPEVMAFTPMESVPWGVNIRQEEAEALAPAREMQRRFIIFGLSLSLFFLLLAWGIARSVVKPIGMLTSAARRIAGGDLNGTIPHLGSDEVGRLAQSLDTMRARLKESLDRLKGWSQELEQRVRERTRELEESQQARGELLRRVISAQEEERKRIARELHDDTSQALAALAMAMDMEAQAPGGTGQERLAKMKELVLRTLDGVHKMVFDLRPSVLDDLGLIPTLRWYAESRLKPLGVRVHMEVSGDEVRLPAEMETVLFRVVQEAITNIAKHAEAENAVINVELEDSAISIEVEDDGRGFDMSQVAGTPDQARGLGLLGMRERVALLLGSIKIDSKPGKGTVITIKVPLPKGAAHE